MVSSNLMNLFKVAPVLLGASFITAQAQPVFAQSSNTSSEEDVLQQIENYNNQGDSNSLNQVNSVFQLRDVSPDDWAFEALRNLVERYGCIAGYPDGTFRGNQALTRYEFAAGLNACLQQIERLIAQGGGEVTKEDLQTLQRLTQEFEAELATLGTRVDNLEGRVATLEDNQFSTTTKLSGTARFASIASFGDDDHEGSLAGQDTSSNPGFVYDVVMDFEASFTGRDELKVSLQSANFGGFADGGTGVDDGALEFEDDRGGEDVKLEDLVYSFPLGERVRVAIGANDFDADDAFEYSYGSPLELSEFTNGEEALTDGAGLQDDVGISTNIGLTEKISLGVGYTTATDNATDPDIGLTRDYNLATNLNYGGDNFDIGVAYNLTQAGAPDIDFTRQAIGARGALRLGSSAEIGAFVEYIDEDQNNLNASGDFSRDGFSFGANLSFYDIAKEGSKLGLSVASRAFFDEVESDDGTTPIGGSFGALSDLGPDPTSDEQDRTWIAEVGYDFPVNDNVSITPGVIAIFNPERDSDNNEIFIGVLRTTFSF